LQKRVTAVEEQIAEVEARLAGIEAKLSAPSSAEEALRLSGEYTEVQNEIMARMEEWEVATLELEELG
jgi:predicted  nucleic acid-binding Zn-ribbon protein